MRKRLATLNTRANRISQRKARTILHEGVVRGHKLTDKQRRFFGALSNKKG